MAIRSSSLSRRYGVAVSPSQRRAGICLTACSNAACWDVVAFVGDDQAVPGGQLRDVAAAGQGLQGDDIDAAAQLGPAAAELPGFDAKELGDPGPPLVRERLAVHQDQSGDLMRGRLRRRIEAELRPRYENITGAYFALFGAAVAIWVAIPPLLMAKGLPSWVTPTFVVSGVAFLALGLTLVFVAQLLRRNTRRSAEEISNELREIGDHTFRGSD
jgi:hypothetical protein